MSSARPDKSQCSEFRLHFNEQSFGVCRQLLSSPSPHPGSLACCQLLSISDPLLEPACGAHMVTGHAAAGDAWLCSPGRESVWTHGPVHHHVGKREFICFLGIILAWAWDRPSAFSALPNIFPNFTCFRWVHLPTDPFFPQAWVTGLFGVAPLCHFDF